MVDRLSLIIINLESASVISLHVIQIIVKSYQDGVYLQIETIGSMVYKMYIKKRI